MNELEINKDILEDKSVQEDVHVDTTASDNSNEPQPEQVLVEPKVQTKRRYHVDSTIYTFLAVFGIVWLSFIYVFQVLLSPIKVVGISMQPTINLSVISDTDENHCDIVYYSEEEKYNNGDVVIVENVDLKYINDEDVEYLIKRVIATGGQSIKFIPNKEDSTVAEYYYTIEVYSKHDAEGKKLKSYESFIKEPMKFNIHTHFINCSSYAPFYEIFGSFISIENHGIIADYSIINIPENEYFVMGDNRNNSVDSRYFGTVKHSHISGSVKLQLDYGETLFEAIWDKIKSAF